MVTVLLPLSTTQRAECVLAERTLKSLTTQEGTWRIIVAVNGRETELLAPIRARFASHEWVTWIEYPRLNHLSLALNFALAHALPTTQLVNVASPEYVYEAGALEWALSLHQRSPEAGLIYGDEIDYDLHQMPVDWGPHPLEYDRRLLLQQFCWIHLPACFLNYRLLLARGGFEVIEEDAPDWDIILRFSHYGVIHLKRAVVSHYWPTSFFAEGLSHPRRLQVIRDRLVQGFYGNEAIIQANTWKPYRLRPMADK